MRQRRDIGRPVERPPMAAGGTSCPETPRNLYLAPNCSGGILYCGDAASRTRPSPQPRDVPPCITLAHHYVFYMQQEKENLSCILEFVCVRHRGCRGMFWVFPALCGRHILPHKAAPSRESVSSGGNIVEFLLLCYTKEAKCRKRCVENEALNYVPACWLSLFLLMHKDFVAGTALVIK